MAKKDERPIDRRRFFREGFRELFKPLSKAIDPIERVARELGNLERPEYYGTPAPPKPKPVIRPPGALPEQQFLDVCSRCGKCAEVCPAQCIKLDPAALTGGGAPFIDVETMPCVLCDGLKCMPACPTGALVVTPLNEIEMGTAEWREHLCVRSHGTDCTICVDHCPRGSAALELKDNKVHVIPEGCTGCGVCQYQCPTYPKSIVVVPKSAQPA